MMKLKYLFDNRELAGMILNYWEYDPDKLSLFDYYRISSNAVYPFEFKGERRYLRFSPVEERTEEVILAELEYIRYLRSWQYPAAGIISSIAGKDLERIQTPWGDYLAVVFQGVPGKRLDRITLNDDLIAGYGKALGRLHRLSRAYLPAGTRRVSWREQLDWIEHTLAGFPDELAAKDEVNILRSCLERFPATDDNFGLVHYDFERDNVFYDEAADRFHVIDFDDAVYHWYALELDQSLDNLTEDMTPDRAAKAKDLFIEGYRSVCSIDDRMLPALPVFRRYVNLYGYTRIIRATAEKWEDEPEWLVGLRKILDTAKAKRREYFGMPIIMENSGF
jgi:Ser/Thr protein kinase RdoA (MazF antagonist)